LTNCHFRKAASFAFKPLQSLDGDGVSMRCRPFALVTVGPLVSAPSIAKIVALLAELKLPVVTVPKGNDLIASLSGDLSDCDDADIARGA